MHTLFQGLRLSSKGVLGHYKGELAIITYYPLILKRFKT